MVCHPQKEASKKDVYRSSSLSLRSPPVAVGSVPLPISTTPIAEDI